MQSLKLNLSSYGDPFDKRTWSGTSLNIVNELKTRDALGCAFDFKARTASRVVAKVLMTLTQRFYGKTEVERAPLMRKLAGMRAAYLSSRSPFPQHTMHMGTLCLPLQSILKRNRHYVYVDSTWDIFRRFATNISDYSLQQIGLFERLDAEAFKSVDHIFTTGEHVRENLIGHYGVNSNKVTVVGTGLGTIAPYFGKKDYANKKILFTAKGRFKDKGGELVISAFRKAAEIDPDLKLTIVGSEDGLKIDGHDRITTLGFVSMEVLQELFETHSLFVMPAFYEPWGLVYLEALACKMPIAGLNRNSIPEFVGQGKHGFVFENETVDAVAQALVDAFKDQDRLRMMGDAGQEYCLNRYGWDKVLDRILETIRLKG